mgnify:CR=1 FL=1
MKVTNKDRINVMDMLATMLKASTIPFERLINIDYRYNDLYEERFPDGRMFQNQIKFVDENKGRFLSAICHIGSYGYDDATIEVYFGYGTPAAYLTIEQAFNLIRDYWKNVGGFADEIQD